MSGRPRGADEVRAALVRAAGELLGSKAPHDISGREIAERAGVNYGLIHHYFGGKDALVRSGLSALAESYAAGPGDRSWSSDEPFSIRHRPDYLRAVAFASLAGEIDDVMTVNPVVEAVLDRVSAERRAGNAADEVDEAVRIDVAVGTLFNLGWSLFESAVEPWLGLDADQREEMERRLRQVLRANLHDQEVAPPLRGLPAA